MTVKSDGTVYAWGNNQRWQLGYGRPPSFATTPVQPVPLGSPDLAITINASATLTVGTSATYTITGTNVSPTATSGPITVTDQLPPGLRYLSATGTGWACSPQGMTITCTNPGPINPGASSAITLSVHVGAEAIPGVTNIAKLSNPSDLNESNTVTGFPVAVGLPVQITAGVNAASFAQGPISPGAIVTIFGTNLGPPALAAYELIQNNTRLASTVADTTVLFDDVPAPIIYVRHDQLSVVVPFEIAGRSNVNIKVRRRDQTSAEFSQRVTDVTPGIFTVNQTGFGQGLS